MTRIGTDFLPAERLSRPWPSMRLDATAKGGARCVNHARRDLCGLRTVGRVSTAMLEHLRVTNFTGDEMSTLFRFLCFALAPATPFIASPSAAIDLNFPDGTSVHRVTGSGLLVPVGDANGDGIDDLAKINPRATPQTGNCLLAVYGAVSIQPAQTVPTVGGQFCSNGNTSEEFRAPVFGSNFCGIGSNSIVFQAFGQSGGRLHTMPRTGTVNFQVLFLNCGPSARAISNLGDVTGDQKDDFWVGASSQSSQGQYLSSSSLGFCPNATVNHCEGVAVRRIAGLDPKVVRLGDVGGSPKADLAFRFDNTVYALYVDSIDDLDSMTSGQGFRLSSSEGGSVTSLVGDVDFNGDGLLDIAIGFGDASTSGLANNGRVYLVYGGPDGFPFDVALDAPSPSVARIDGSLNAQHLGERIAALDFDDDGVDDLVVSGALGQLYVLFGSQQVLPSGTIASYADSAAVVRGPVFSPRAEIASGFDFNDDGKEDFGVGADNTANYFVVFGRSNELFSDSFEE